MTSVDVDSFKLMAIFFTSDDDFLHLAKLMIGSLAKVLFLTWN